MNKVILIISISATLLISSCAKKTVTASFGRSSQYTTQNNTEKTELETVPEIVNKKSTADLATLHLEKKAPQKRTDYSEFEAKLNKHQKAIDKLNKNEENLSKKDLKKEKKQIQKEFKSDLKDEIKSAKANNASDDYMAMLIISIIICPIGMGLLFGWGSTEFWIGLVLFLLFWLPGAIYGAIKASGTA